MKMFMMLSRIVLCAGVALVAACGKSESPPASSAPATVAVAADPKIQRLYDQTCKSCHGIPGTGAPQTGDAAAWTPRVAQGMDKLLDHTLGGLRGMPPLGSCGDCSEEEFVALIRYMAQIP